MKRKILVTVLLCALLCLAFALTASAKCEQCDYEYTVTTTRDGFLGNISVSGKCSVCSDTVTETIEPLFETLGFSYSNGGIVQGYYINKQAIARYEELTGSTLEYGSVIASRNAIGLNNPLDKDGNPISAKVKVNDLTNSKYDIVDVVIKGIPQEQKDSAKLLCALYVIADGVVSYIDNSVQKAACTAYTHSEVVSVPKKEAAQADTLMTIDGVKYRELSAAELNLVQGYYWHRSNGFKNDGVTSFVNRFWGTKNSFTKKEIPNGSIIVINPSAVNPPSTGEVWEYRPDALNCYDESKRPVNVSDTWTVVNDTWWSTWTARGFNFTTNSTSTDLSGYTEEQIRAVFKIYVPINLCPAPAPVVPEDPTVTPENPTPDEPGTEEPNPDEPDEPQGPTTPETPVTPVEKQNWNDDGVLKILTIGNSFSDDSMEYVYQAAQAAGIKNVVLGNLFIGGCSLDTHLDNAKNDKTKYTYRTNTSGKWSSTGDYTIKAAVESQNWDFISFQQASTNSGQANTYDSLVELISIVEPLCPAARLVWHMTWAYQADSTHSGFKNYGNDQMTMYNAIVGAVQSKVVTNEDIEIIIPAGTAVQNVRTSYIGDTVTRDGYHLDYYVGRYIGSLTFVKALTGVSIDNVKYMPENVDENELAVLIECVNNAIATPFSVTASQYKTAPGTPDEPQGPPTPENPELPGEGYKQLSALELGLTANAFYNVSSSSDGYSVNANDTWNQGFVATKKLSKKELPVGSIIVIATGWQYRPEGFKFDTSRPDPVSTYIVEVTEEWWANYEYRAFNISHITHVQNNRVKITETLDEIAETIFMVYVPVTEPDPGEGEGGGTGEPDVNEPDEPQGPPTPENPEDPENPDDNEDETEPKAPTGYREVELTLTKYAYYQSNASEDAKKNPILVVKDQYSSPAKNYFATEVFTKETLPIGSVIYVGSAWNYRPEGWKYVSSVGRPTAVHTQYVVVTEEWWGSYTQRAFNICRDSGDIINYTAEQVAANFKIFVPDETVAVKQLSADEMGLTKNAFWWSSPNEAGFEDKYYELITSGHGSVDSFFATKLFTKEELPVGTVIEIDADWFYRPEGWVNGAKNSSRPDEVQTIRIIVTEEWWGDFTERAFNIALDTKENIKNYTIEDAAKAFKIYVPVTE